MPKVAVSGYTKVRLLTVIRLVTMPKVAVSGYTKVRLLTVTQPAIWFHCTISLKSLGFADCICPAKVESVIDAATIRWLSYPSRCIPWCPTFLNTLCGWSSHSSIFQSQTSPANSPGINRLSVRTCEYFHELRRMWNSSSRFRINWMIRLCFPCHPAQLIRFGGFRFRTIPIVRQCFPFSTRF